MKNPQDKLSKLLHQKLDNLDVNMNTNSTFDALQIKLSLQKFFYFHPRHFNIYYATVILTSLVVNVGLGIQYFKNQKAIEKEILAMNAKIDRQQLAYQQLLQNTNLSTNALNNRVEKVSRQKVKPSIISKNTQSNGVIKEKIKIEKELMAALQGADSSSTKIASTQERKAEETPTKTLYIVKQDTIIQYDSIPLIPRKARKK